MPASQTIRDIQSLLGNDWNSLKEFVKESLVSDIAMLNTINGHLFLSSGKMVRPLLSLLSAKACTSGVLSHTSKVCAATAEIIHTATLLHDDVVDDSAYRRGKLTVNTLFSPGASVLMGDFWLSRAIRLLIDNKCNYKILSYFSKTIEDLAEGEMLQMQRAADAGTSFEDYINIISKKTASLFIASCCSAAVAQNAPAVQEQALHEYAYRLGLSFQMRDDILDYSPTPQDGKDVGSDLAERKITLPLLCAFESAPKLEKKIREIILDIDVTKKAYSEPNNTYIREVREFVFQNSGVDKAKEVLSEYIEASKRALDPLPESESKESLVSIAQILSM